MVALASLQLRVDATQPGQAARTLDSLTASGQRAEVQAGKLADAHNKLATETRQSVTAASQLGAALGALGAAALARDALQAADAYTSMQSRLKLATGSTYELATANQRLFAVAQGSRVGLEATVDLYASLSRSTEQLGLSQERLVGVTETINRALIVSGASAGAAQAALTQLGQGLASGTLRGDELNSVLEQTPRLAKAIADGMGISVGQLRKLGAEGKITSQAIVGALEGQAEKIAAEYDQMEMTIGQAFTKIQNATLKFVGEADQAAGVAHGIAEAMSLAADKIDVVAKVAGVLAGVVGAALVGSMASYAATTLAATASSIALSAAIGGMSISAAAGTVAVRGLSIALGFFGGPIGLAVAAVAAGLGYLAVEGAKARAETDQLRRATSAAEEAFRKYEEAGVAAALASGTGAVEARKAAEAAKTLALAEVEAARATLQRAEAQAIAAKADEARVKGEANTRMQIAAFAGGGGMPYAALAGTMPNAAAERNTEKAEERASAAALGYADHLRKLEEAEERIRAVGNGAAAALDSGAKAATNKSKALDELARATERATATAQSYLASLSKEVAEHGKAASAIKAMEVAAAVEAAPTLYLKDAIREQGDYAVGLLRSAEAVRELNAAAADFKEIPSPDFKGEELEALVDELRLIDSLAYDAGRGMEQAFGRAGRAVAGVLTTLTGYQERMASIAKAEQDGRLKEFEAVREREALQIRSYGNMAAAGRDFFEEGSKGYELLSAAEKAFRIVELGFALQAITMKGAEATATVAAETTMTGASLAGSAARTGAKAAEGIAGIFAALGPFGFPVAAAATAVMVAAGVKMFGGGGRGSAPGAGDMEARQEAQGTGSVLGDSKAKSESIAKSLEIVASNTNKDLEFSNGMLKALRNIETGIDAVAVALSRTLGASGALDTAGLNLGTTGRPATLGNLGFGNTTTRELQDQGLQFGSQSLGDILAGGIDGQAYQQVLQTKVKKAFGITYSNKSSVQTTTGSLDADLANQITSLIGSLKVGVLEAASVLGVTGAEATLDAFRVELGKLSFKDMSGAEIQEALNAIFSKLGDDLAATAIPELTQLQKVGEGAFETLARVARQYQVVDVSLTSIGMTFGAVGVSSLKARERLVDLAGGIDEFADQVSYFAENFLSDLERMAPVQRAVATELERLGLASVKTKDDFKNVVLGLDLTTEAGAKLYAALMDLAPAFAKVIDFQVEGSKEVQTWRDAVIDAYDRESGALENTRDKLLDLAKSLKEFSAGLDPLLDATTRETLDRTQAAMMDLAARADAGDVDALAGLQSSIQDFLKAAEADAGSSLEYQIAVATAQGVARSAERAAMNQATIAEQQLAVMKASVEAELGTQKAVYSLADALAGYQNAIAAQAAAAVAPPATSNPTPQTPAANDNPAPAERSADWTSYIAHYTDVAAEYARNMASEKGRKYLAQLGIGSAEAFGQWHWNNGGKAEGRTPYAAGGLMDRPITLGESGIGGEAGPEGILPLANVGGKLGVHAVGGSDSAQLARMYAELQNMNASLISIARSTHELNRNFRRAMAEGLYVRGPEPDAPVQTKAAA